MKSRIGKRRSIIEARVDSGEIVVIDNASSSKNISNPENYIYLGEGVYHSIDGVK